MSFRIEKAITSYLLPEDAPQARADFLRLIHAPGESWLLTHSFTLGELADEILVAQGRGVRFHLYLDDSRWSGFGDTGAARLAEQGVEVTVGTSTRKGQYVCHTKGMVTDLAEGPVCWVGPIDFSPIGWPQVNSTLRFGSAEWRDHFVDQFVTLRQFAWDEERHLQVMAEPPPGVDLAEPAASREGGGRGSGARAGSEGQVAEGPRLLLPRGIAPR